MKFADAARTLTGIPYTSPAKGKVFFDLVIRERPSAILELGFAHGVSACYFAAAAQEVGNCSVTAVDLESSRDMAPTIESLVEALDLASIVSVHRETSS